MRCWGGETDMWGGLSATGHKRADWKAGRHPGPIQSGKEGALLGSAGPMRATGWATRCCAEGGNGKWGAGTGARVSWAGKGEKEREEKGRPGWA